MNKKFDCLRRRKRERERELFQYFTIHKFASAFLEIQKGNWLNLCYCTFLRQNNPISLRAISSTTIAEASPSICNARLVLRHNSNNNTTHRRYSLLNGPSRVDHAFSIPVQ
jgi:hypothetical protein